MKPLSDVQTEALLRVARLPGRENGAVMGALQRRGLVRAERMAGSCRGHIPSWVRWHATEEGARLAAEIPAQRRAAELASRAAEGTATVARWALRTLAVDLRYRLAQFAGTREDDYLVRLRDLVAAVNAALGQEGRADVPSSAD